MRIQQTVTVRPSGEDNSWAPGHGAIGRRRWRAFAIAAVMLSLLPSTARAADFQVRDADGVITIAAPNYQLEIQEQGCRYGFTRPDGMVIAPPHDVSGLEFSGGQARTAALKSQTAAAVVLEVTNEAGARATLEIQPREFVVRFAVTADKPGPIVARTGGVGPAFGLGDLAVRHRSSTELTGFVNEDFHADGGQCGRLISNFAIFPQQGFAEVNVEPAVKIVRLTKSENAQGSREGSAMPALYYFFGSPERIYASFLEVRNREGYLVYRPKYEWFGVGWEAFGALAWDTNEKTVTANVSRYLDMGYPLSWMVVGSGFWPRQEPRFHATTSFGMWDKNLYPDPRALIETFHQRSMKFILGLRISFITNGPYAAEGVRGGYFLREGGAAKVFKIGFPRSPCYLLDGRNPAAVKWYTALCGKWLEAGVDGFKEDLFGYQKYVLRDDKIDPVNAALMDRGVYVMGRNGYLGSPMDLHRFEDFNYNQNQDRGPLNGLAFAYSGFPYVYPDIVGGTFGEGLKMPPPTDPRMHAYIMRNAQYASVNPSMSMGYGPWNFKSEQVERVMLGAARLHARLHPYIYSAAVDAAETGFPWTMTPLPLLWPEDPEVYQLGNANRRGYEWMLGPSLLACPLYGNDYATAQTRDVYLPAGRWMDFDTGKVYIGPTTLQGFPLPPGKTPLFVGGQGVLILRELPGTALRASVFPVARPGSVYRFTHADGATRSTITPANGGWNPATLVVTDTTIGKPATFERAERTGGIEFTFVPGHNYRLAGGGNRTAVPPP